MTAPGFLLPENCSFRSSKYLWNTTLLCIVAFSPGAMAQDVLAPPPAPPPLVPSAVEAYQTNQPVQMKVFSPSATAPASQLGEPFQCGPVVIRPNISYQFLYGNGIQSSVGEQQNSIVQQFSPGVLLQEGLHWSLSYTPTFIFYSSSAFRNAINQSVQLQWGTTWGDWFMTASQRYAYSDLPEAETAGQTEEQTYTTDFNGTYHINDRLSTDIGFDQAFINYGQSTSTNSLGLANSRTWSTMDWLNDQFWPRFNAGIGAGLGYNQQQGSPDFVDQQFQLQLSWRTTDKISFQLNGGFQVQEYVSGGANDLITPIFGGGLQYQPFDQTRFSVTASRNVNSSAYENQIVETTSVQGDFNQRLFGGVFLDLNGGFSWADYVASLAGLSTSRNDDIYTFNARLSCPFPKRGTASIFYQYSKDFSTQNGFAASSSGFGYSSNQVGFSISYTY